MIGDIIQNQTKIIEIDRNHIQKFVKIHNYLKTKKENSLFIFNEIKKSSSIIDKQDMLGILKNQVNSYEVLVFHSMNMLGSLLSDDLITFYEIYESFDKLGIFNSSWENEVSEKLINIGDKLNDLMYSIVPSLLPPSTKTNSNLSLELTVFSINLGNKCFLFNVPVTILIILLTNYHNKYLTFANMTMIVQTKLLVISLFSLNFDLTTHPTN